MRAIAIQCIEIIGYLKLERKQKEFLPMNLKFVFCILRKLKIELTLEGSQVDKCAF